jgi:hypothetical protein
MDIKIPDMGCDSQKLAENAVEKNKSPNKLGTCNKTDDSKGQGAV